jgi:hypothetical protein
MEEASLPDQKKMPRKKRGIKRWWLGARAITVCLASSQIPIQRGFSNE